MAVYKLLDFSDIYTAVAEELKVQQSDTSSMNRIKRMINMMYLDEVVPASRWWWLHGHTTVTQKAYYASGTASVTPNSTTVTLSVAPTTSVGNAGSFLNYLFSVDGKNEIYRITAHTAEATTFTIDKGFNTELNATANFKIWKDAIDLPTDLRETQEVWHDHMRGSMEPRGMQDFRKVVSEDPKYENRPAYYATADFSDPSTGTGETESDRVRQLRVYPSISQYNTILKVDYIKEVDALENAGDEPVLPVEDRIVLFYGALSLAWGSIGRNPEEAIRNRQLFDAKLSRMMGKVQDSMDKPRIEPESRYIMAKRAGRISTYGRAVATSGGQSSYNAPNYLDNPTIHGAVITDDVTVNASITIDGRDISVDGAALDAHLVDTTAHGTTGDVVGTSDTQTLTNKTIDASTNTISNIVNANINASAAIAKSKLAAGTASRVEVTDGSGNLTESVITSTELTYLDDVEALTSATCTDNTSNEVIATWAVASFDSISLQYSLKRSTSRESGIINIVSDGSSAAIAQSYAGIGTSGVTFSVDISGGNVRLLATSTSTGSNGTLKYKVNKWLC